MPRKKAAKAKRRLDKQVNFRCTDDDHDKFRRCSELEGFNSATAWMLYHLRRAAKDTLKREEE